MSTVPNFLECLEVAPSEDLDPARRLYQAHIKADADLNDTRAEILRFIEHQKNSKGAWVPAFSPDMIDEAATLGGRIEAGWDKLKSIGHDIETFLGIAEGKPSIIEIVKKRSEGRRAINQAHLAARAAREAATNRNPNLLWKNSPQIPKSWKPRNVYATRDPNLSRSLHGSIKN